MNILNADGDEEVAAKHVGVGTKNYFDGRLDAQANLEQLSFLTRH